MTAAFKPFVALVVLDVSNPAHGVFEVGRYATTGKPARVVAANGLVFAGGGGPSSSIDVFREIQCD